MKMVSAWCLVVGFAVVVASASSAVPRQTDQQSLKNALDAITRKQRSLDFVPQDYYNELRSFKFHPGDAPDDKFERERQQNQDLDDDDDEDDEDLEFLPLDNGQLENIGGGYQNFNNKRLERALIDYLENPPAQRANVPSPFRERERSGGHKRGITNERTTPNEGNKELAALFYKELQNGPSYNTMGDVDNQDYLLSDTLQSYYDRYRAEQNKLDRNKLYESSSGPMSWGEIFGKQESARNRASQKNNVDDNDDDVNDRDHDQEPMYLLPAERRNVNGRYPLGREYGVLLKRYPLLTKRSPKPLQSEHQNAGVITDPKVAKDLGALFGGQTGETKNNHTHDHRDTVQHAAQEQNEHHEGGSHVNEHVNGDHAHTHGHDHDHDHDHNHDHDHERHATSAGPHELEAVTTSEAPNGLNGPQGTSKPGQKEISNGGNKVGKILTKRDHRAIQVKKKSVDWSEYFGIDRRKKKAALLARAGSQDQDDEWMLQRYYKTMAENLKSPGKNAGSDKEYGVKRDKLDQMDTRLKDVKNLIVEDALKYGSEDNSDAEEVKDVVMARLAAAYSLEKMRRALNEFRSNIAAQRELMRAANAKNSTTSNYRDESNGNENVNEKRNGNSIADDESNPYEGRNFEGVDEGRGCLEVESIERSCRPAKGLIAGLYEPCVMHQICRACDDEEECSNIFAVEAAKVCENMRDSHEARESFGHCAQMALVIWQMQPSPIASAVCHSSAADSCLRRQYRYRHRALYYQNGWLPHVAFEAPSQHRQR